MMKLGLSIRQLGYHIAAWRHPDVLADGAVRYDHFLRTVRMAEEALFDFVFFADSLAIRDTDRPRGALARSSSNVELEPLTLLAALAPMTRSIGLVATASTSYNEPFHTARKFASIDHISGGRAGWNVVTSWSDAEARNFNRSAQLGKAARYARAQEFLDVVLGLWRSWEPDAFVRDKVSGQFYREGARHDLNHVGEHFQVQGPLTIPATPQGRPVIFQAGASEDGRDLAARYSDCVYVNADRIEDAQELYRDLKGRLPRYGREASDLVILPGLVPYVAATRQEARDDFDRMQELIDPIAGYRILYRQFGDLSAYDAHGRLPELAVPPPTSEGLRIYENARRQGFTIAQLYMQVAASGGLRTVIGTADDVADEMEAWFTGGAADGFNISPPRTSASVHAFATMVIPELQRRGLFRKAYSGQTLRENLGLRPVAASS